MTEKELKKLTRYQLLELLIVQTERADKLQQELEVLQKQLNDQAIRATVVGSIAEEAMQLSGVFEAAQKAADLYLETIQKKAEGIVQEAEEKARQLLQDAQPKPQEPPEAQTPQEPQNPQESPNPDRTEKLWDMLEAL